MGQMRRTATAKSYIEEKNFRCILNNGGILPAKEGVKAFLDGIDPETAKDYCTMVDNPDDADINTTGSSLVITEELKGLPQAMILSFDPTDAAVMDIVFGRHNPKSKLPFEIPSSMDAVRAQKEDVPFDSKDPSFPFGFGLSY